MLDAYRDLLQAWPVPSDQVLIPTRLGETFVVSSGPNDAPALVLLHGTAANAASWTVDISVWARAFRVHAVDILGDAGLSARVRPDYGSGAYAEWLDDVMDRLGVASAAFAGMSLGGWIALDYASRRPQRVDRLALFSPGGVGRNRNVLLWAAPLLLL